MMVAVSLKLFMWDRTAAGFLFITFPVLLYATARWKVPPNANGLAGVDYKLIEFMASYNKFRTRVSWHSVTLSLCNCVRYHVIIPEEVFPCTEMTSALGLQAVSVPISFTFRNYLYSSDSKHNYYLNHLPL